MPQLSKRFVQNHLLMYLLALTLPPIYFVVRKRYLVALGLTSEIICLTNWSTVYALAAILLAVFSQSIQLAVDLYFHFVSEPEELPGLQFDLN